MSRPAIRLAVEPVQDKAVTFQRLAPRNKHGDVLAQISLLLKITNRESSRIVLRNVGLAVFFSDNRPAHEQSNPVNIGIEPGASGHWHNLVYTVAAEKTGFGVDTHVNQNMVTSPLANILRITLAFRGFDDPVVKHFALRPHQSPTPKRAYQFPAKKGDLRKGECWIGAGARHAQSSYGNQLFALDVVAAGWDQGSGTWSQLLPAELRDGSKHEQNKDHRIWHKPVYAMADGVIVDLRWNFPENPVPSGTPTDVVAKFMKSGKDGNGNFVKIRTGDEVHLYAHFADGSIPQKLRAKGLAVKKGDLLGAVGNSGNSTGPHLHFGVLKHRRLVTRGDADFVLRPMPFVDMHSLHSRGIKRIHHDDPWFRHDGHGLSIADFPDRCLIWPSRVKPAR